MPEKNEQRNKNDMSSSCGFVQSEAAAVQMEVRDYEKTCEKRVASSLRTIGKLVKQPKSNRISGRYPHEVTGAWAP